MNELRRDYSEPANALLVQMMRRNPHHRQEVRNASLRDARAWAVENLPPGHTVLHAIAYLDDALLALDQVQAGADISVLPARARLAKPSA